MPDLDPILIGRTWHFPDGATLPLVAGGSDIDFMGGPQGIEMPDPSEHHFEGGDDDGTDPGDGGGGQPDGGAQPPAAPPTGEPPAAGDEPTTFATMEAAIAEVRKTRQEAAGYRVRVRQFEETFANLHPDDLSAVGDFMAAYKSNDTAAMAQWLNANGKLLLGDRWAQFVAQGGQAPSGQTPPAGQPAPAAQPSPFDLSDPAALEKAIAARVEAGIKDYDTQRQEAEATREAATEILDGLRKANGGQGYPVQSAAGRHILFLMRETNDIGKAVEQYEAEMEKAVGSYAERKQAQAAAAAGTTPASAGGGAGSSDEFSDEEKEEIRRNPLKEGDIRMNRRLRRNQQGRFQAAP